MKAEQWTKTEIRTIVRNNKKALTKEEIERRSHKLFQKIVELPEYRQSTRVYSYVSYNQEVSTFEFMRRVLSDKKTLLVPKVYGDIMRYHEILDLNELKPGAYGILEPDTNRPDSVFEGFMLLPGLAFDKKGHRIGYGGGFYDKYLSEHPAYFKAAPAYDFQVFDEIPFEKYDILIDRVIAENEERKQ